MSSTGTRTLRFKNVTEVQFSYTLNFGSTGTTPQRLQTMHTKWMSDPGTNEVQEAIFDKYLHKKLAKFTWNLRNFRLFIETRTTVATIGTAPPVTDIQIVEAPRWVYWYWRQQTEYNANPPAAQDEGRYTRFVCNGPNSKIYGKVPFPYKNMQWVNGLYANLFNPTSGLYPNLDTYLQDTDGAIYGSKTTSGVPVADIHIMPDDPYPSTFFPNPTTGTTRTVILHIQFDQTTYATWKLLRPVTS